MGGKHKIPEDLIDDAIAWDQVGTAIAKEPMGKRRWLCKHLARQCGVGVCLQTRQQQDHARCPCCDAEEEDTTHVIKCSAVSARVIWMTAIEHLFDWMMNEKTDLTLAEIITERLASWHAGDALKAV